MHKLEIPGVSILIKIIPDGELPCYDFLDKEAKIKTVVGTEFSVSYAMREFNMDNALEEAYKTLAIQVFKRYLEDTRINVIIIGIRSHTWDTAFRFTEIEAPNVANEDVKGLLHGVFSITTFNSKVYALLD